MKHFVFEDTHTGEEFIVGEETVDDAIELVEDCFDGIKYLCEFTDEEAEASGLDEY